jgi:hypothetical protein
MALDAVRSRPLIMATRALSDAASSGAAMVIAGARVTADPTGTVRAQGVTAARGDAALQMTGVTARGRVARGAGRGSRARLHGVHGEEVSAVHLRRGDRIRATSLERERLIDRVAVHTRGLRVALGADPFTASGRLQAVGAHPAGVMPHERERLGPREVLRRVTARTVGLVEVLLVARQAARHGRVQERRRARLDDALVALDALSSDALERQVFAVVEGPIILGRVPGGLPEAALRLLMASRAQAHVRLGHLCSGQIPVAARAGQTRWFAGTPAFDPGEVHQVRELRGRWSVTAAVQRSGYHQEDPEAAHHVPPRSTWKV